MKFTSSSPPHPQKKRNPEHLPTLLCCKKKYRVYLHPKSGPNYVWYIEVKNSCTMLIKKIRKEYGKQVAKDSKANSKIYRKVFKRE